MSTVALISLALPQAVIATYGALPNAIPLPNGTIVYSAQAGWVSADGQFALVNVAPFSVPVGQQTTGAPSYSVSNGVVTQTFTTQAIPAVQLAQQQFNAALAAGITLTWSSSTALNDTYALDTATQVRMLAERVSVAVNSTFTNGSTTLTWFGMTGTQHTLSVTQAGLFVKAVWMYLTALFVAQATAAAGGTASWPNETISVTG